MIAKIILLIVVSQSGILAVTFIASNYQKSSEQTEWGAASLLNYNRGSVVACGLECAQTPDCFHYKFDTDQILRCILYIEPTRLVPPTNMPSTAVRMVASRWENGDFVMQVPTTGITSYEDAYNRCIEYSFKLPPPPITGFDWHVLQGFTRTLMDVNGVYPTRSFYNFVDDGIVEVPGGSPITFLQPSEFPVTDEVYCGVATLIKVTLAHVCDDPIGPQLSKRLVCIK